MSRDYSKALDTLITMRDSLCPAHQREAPKVAIVDTRRRHTLRRRPRIDELLSRLHHGRPNTQWDRDFRSTVALGRFTILDTMDLAESQAELYSYL